PARERWRASSGHSHGNDSREGSGGGAVVLKSLERAAAETACRYLRPRLDPMAGFFSFLLGLRAQQPGEFRRLTRIRRRIYTPVARLEAEVVRSAEPIPFGELDRASFAPIRAGAAFGGVLECAWLRLTGEVPADANGAVVLLGIRGEALVYDADGGIVDSVSTV